MVDIPPSLFRRNVQHTGSLNNIGSSLPSFICSPSSSFLVSLVSIIMPNYLHEKVEVRGEVKNKEEDMEELYLVWCIPAGILGPGNINNTGV